jgi:hypothetical protein
MQTSVWQGRITRLVPSHFVASCIFTLENSSFKALYHLARPKHEPYKPSLMALPSSKIDAL